jgi:hypothetical protein
MTLTDRMVYHYQLAKGFALDIPTIHGARADPAKIARCARAGLRPADAFVES